MNWSCIVDVLEMNWRYIGDILEIYCVKIRLSYDYDRQVKGGDKKRMNRDKGQGQSDNKGSDTYARDAYTMDLYYIII